MVVTTRVLHVASGDLWAGAEVQLYHLACCVNDQADIELQVVLLNSGELQRRLIAVGVAVEVIPESQHGFVALLFKLMSISRYFQPDIIHTHRQKENLLGALTALVIPGTQSVRTVHGGNEHAPRGKQIVKRLQLLVNRWVGCYLQQAIVCVSEELKTLLRGDYPAAKLLVIENGVDVDAVRELAAGDKVDLVKERFNVAFAGRMVPVKRVDLFVEIARLAEQKYKGKFHFYVLGDGPEMQAALNLAAEYGLDNLTFTGFRADAQQWLVKMNALCITSDHEGLPMVLLEAMALNLPVVARMVGGIGQALSNGAAGVLIDSADPGLFVEALNGLRTNSMSSNTLVAAAWLRVNKEFSVAVMAEQYKSLYQRLLATNL